MPVGSESPVVIPATTSEFCVRTGPKLPPCSYGDKDKLDVQALVTFQESKIQYRHQYRLRFLRIWRQADLYKQFVQWLRGSFNWDSSLTPWWSRLEFQEDDADAVPTPVVDDFGPPIDNEAARLGKPEYEAYARTNDRADLKTRNAAEIAEDVLKDALDRAGFKEEREKGELHMPLYGGWLLLSYWKKSFTDTVRIPVLEALKCPQCDFKVAGPLIAADRIDDDKYDAVEANADVDDETGKFKVDSCLTCDTHPGQAFGPDATGALGMQPAALPGGPKLEPFLPMGDEVNQQDHFGRDMGKDVPRGSWAVETGSPYDFYPENLGIDVNGDEIKAFTWERVVKLDEIQNLYANGYLVRPEDPMKVAEFHPIGGERAIFFSGIVTPSAGFAFQNCARLRITCIDPFRELVKDDVGNPVMDDDGRPLLRLNRGRYFVLANGVCLEDDDLMIESANNPGELIKRMHCEYIPFNLRSGGREMWGVSLSEGLFDLADYSNLTWSQIEDCQTTMGVPKWLVERTLDLDFDSGSRSGGIWQYTFAGPDIPKPETVGNELMNPEIFQALAYKDNAIARIARNGQVEQGNVPPGVAAALAIQMLAEQAGEVRRPRIARIKRAMERIFTHGLQLLHELVREERELWVEREDSTWRSRCWQGIDLAGVTEIKIKAEPEHDTEIQRQQSIRDMMAANLFDLTDPRVRRILAKELGVKSEIIAEEEKQEEQAEREFINLRDEGQQPVVDEDLDDHPMHAERHGIDIMSDYWRDCEDRGHWDQALRVLSGWDKPQPAMVPQLNPQTNEPLMDQMGQPITAPGMGPAPFEAYIRQATAQPGGPPRLVEDQILACWQLLLSNAPPDRFTPPQTPEEQEALATVMGFRAHRAAHIKLAEAEKQAAQAGQIQLAAPAGAETNAGTVPTPGQPEDHGQPAEQPQAGA